MKVKSISARVLGGLTLMITMLLVSCMNDVTSSLRSMPTAIGKTNEVIVVADDLVWQSAVGDTFRYYFGAAYPIMPAPEPIFDIRHFSPEYLLGGEERRELRTYVILADINDNDSPATKMAAADIGEEQLRRFRELKQSPKAKIGKDRWAKEQIVAYVLGNGKEALGQSIKDNFPQLAARINSHDEKQVEAKTYVSGIHHGMGQRIMEKFGIEIKIPQGYAEAISDEDFQWLKYDGDQATYNLIFHKFVYEDQEQLTPTNLKAIRNELGQKYVTSNTAGSYMVINAEDLPVFDYTREIDGNYAIEIRGVWEMTADFMGGPFFSWLILNQAKNELLFIDAFVLAPGEDKRDFMQQLELIVQNIRFVNAN